jgi:hypothetical protein
MYEAVKHNVRNQESNAVSLKGAKWETWPFLMRTKSDLPPTMEKRIVLVSLQRIRYTPQRIWDVSIEAQKPHRKHPKKREISPDRPNPHPCAHRP